MSESRRPFVSIVVPVYNEQEVLPLFYEKLCYEIDALPYQFQILFVNDGSRDASEEIIRNLANQDTRVSGVFFSRNFGHQAALTAGLDYATGDAVISMDGDLQHPPALLKTLLEYWQDGYDIVYTIRKDGDDRFTLKKATSSWFYKLINVVTSTKIHPGAADFRLLDRKVVRVFKEDLRERHRFLRGIVNWVGFRSIGIEFTVAQRASGTSKYSLRKMFKLASNGLVSFSTAPLTVGIYLGAILGVLSMAYGIYAVLIAVVAQVAVPGWASLLAAITFLGAIQLFLIGLIGLYIGYLFEEVKGRPIYIVRDTTQLKALNSHRKPIEQIYSDPT